MLSGEKGPFTQLKISRPRKAGMIRDEKGSHENYNRFPFLS